MLYDEPPSCPDSWLARIWTHPSPYMRIQKHQHILVYSPHKLVGYIFSSGWYLGCALIFPEPAPSCHPVTPGVFITDLKTRDRLFPPHCRELSAPSLQVPVKLSCISLEETNKKFWLRLSTINTSTGGEHRGSEAWRGHPAASSRDNLSPNHTWAL